MEPDSRNEARDAAGRFRPGVSGNPGGRRRSLAGAIQEATGDGRELVEFMLAVLRGELDDVRVEDQIRAATWLADRGFGKPAPGKPEDVADGPVEVVVTYGPRHGGEDSGVPARHFEAQHPV